jgi:hypothetical protein
MKNKIFRIFIFFKKNSKVEYVYSEDVHFRFRIVADISNSSKTSNKSQQPSQEVGLSNDLQKTNTKTKNETNQIETNDSENKDPENEDPKDEDPEDEDPEDEDPENEDAENEDAEDEDAEDEDAENEDAENDDELMCDNEIFGDILTKIKDFVDKTNQKFKKNI